MSRLEERLTAMGITVPERVWNKGKNVAVNHVGDLLYVGGHGPTDSDGVMRLKGKLGRDLSVEQGYQAARNCAVVAFGNLKSYLGDLDRIVRVVRVLGFVNATEEFQQHGAVIDGFSDVWIDLLGEQGRHARSSIGVSSLAGGISVEIECTLQVR